MHRLPLALVMSLAKCYANHSASLEFDRKIIQDKRKHFYVCKTQIDRFLQHGILLETFNSAGQGLGVYKTFTVHEV